MLLSINWLKDYLQKQDLKISPRELADQLTMRGLAVESVSQATRGLENVVAGRIEKIEKHPNADRLQVTQVITSEEAGEEPRQIVCGASNISEGDIVPVALPGAVLPGEFKIKRSKIRGVQSDGMLCSGKELELSDDSGGILQLPKHSTIGQPLSQLVGSDDTVLEFELTPNRGDCLSILGLSREIAPILRTRIREPKAPRFRVSSHRTSSIIKVEVDDPEICPRYVARVIDHLKVLPSPDWIQQRLKSVGVRPINNIVDITNFVMLECGQPLHAFDLRKIESGGVRVARCKESSQFETLTGETVTLEPGDILIQDGDRPIALAGIVGGAGTQVQEDTTSILLESAYFPSDQIRRTARRLGLHTESSKRFERKVDLAGVAKASERAAALLRDSFEGDVYHPPIDTNSEPIKTTSISVDMREIRRITGLHNLSAEKTSDILESIGVSTHKRSVNILTAKLPSFRPDLEAAIDIVEEVARLIGYDTIPERFPLSPAPYERSFDAHYDFENRIRNILCQMGLRESIHYSFTSDNNLIRFGNHSENLVRLQNPISEEMKTMRPSLLPSLLQTYLYNKNRRSMGQRLFEIARTYEWNDRSETGVKESECVSGLVSGQLLPANWNHKETTTDFYLAKGLVENLVKQLTTIRLSYEPLEQHKLFHPKRSASVKLGLSEVGWVGEVHPYVRNQILKAEEPVILFELKLEPLRKYQRTTFKYKSPSKFPTIECDIAIMIDKSVSSDSIIETIKQSGSELLSNVDVFDVYEGENIPLGKKSLAFHLSFVAGDRTLHEEEVHALRDKITRGLEEKHSAQLRA